MYVVCTGTRILLLNCCIVYVYMYVLLYVYLALCIVVIPVFNKNENPIVMLWDCSRYMCSSTSTAACYFYLHHLCASCSTQFRFSVVVLHVACVFFWIEFRFTTSTHTHTLQSLSNMRIEMQRYNIKAINRHKYCFELPHHTHIKLKCYRLYRMLTLSILI